jgi:predicted phosphodiesterase
MSKQRILACGDNHGDTEALEWLIDETEQDEFDFVVHTGDITNAYKTNLETRYRTAPSD